MSTKVRSMKEAQRGVADAQSLMRIGEGSLNSQSQIATRIQELAIQGANAGLTPEARARRSAARWVRCNKNSSASAIPLQSAQIRSRTEEHSM